MLVTARLIPIVFSPNIWSNKIYVVLGQFWNGPFCQRHYRYRLPRHSIDLIYLNLFLVDFYIEYSYPITIITLERTIAKQNGWIMFLNYTVRMYTSWTRVQKASQLVLNTQGGYRCVNWTVAPLGMTFRSSLWNTVGVYKRKANRFLKCI